VKLKPLPSRMLIFHFFRVSYRMDYEKMSFKNDYDMNVDVSISHSFLIMYKEIRMIILFEPSRASIPYRRFLMYRSFLETYTPPYVVQAWAWAWAWEWAA
jgi:hypothetical protein